MGCCVSSPEEKYKSNNTACNTANKNTEESFHKGNSVARANETNNNNNNLSIDDGHSVNASKPAAEPDSFYLQNQSDSNNRLQQNQDIIVVVPNHYQHDGSHLMDADVVDASAAEAVFRANPQQQQDCFDFQHHHETSNLGHDDHAKIVNEINNSNKIEIRRFSQATSCSHTNSGVMSPDSQHNNNNINHNNINKAGESSSLNTSVPNILVGLSGTESVNCHNNGNFPKNNSANNNNNSKNLLHPNHHQQQQQPLRQVSSPTTNPANGYRPQMNHSGSIHNLVVPGMVIRRHSNTHSNSGIVSETSSMGTKTSSSTKNNNNNNLNNTENSGSNPNQQHQTSSNDFNNNDSSKKNTSSIDTKNDLTTTTTHSDKQQQRSPQSSVASIPNFNRITGIMVDQQNTANTSTCYDSNKTDNYDDNDDEDDFGFKSVTSRPGTNVVIGRGAAIAAERQNTNNKHNNNNINHGGHNAGVASNSSRGGTTGTLDGTLTNSEVAGTGNGGEIGFGAQRGPGAMNMSATDVYCTSFDTPGGTATPQLLGHFNSLTAGRNDKNSNNSNTNTSNSNDAHPYQFVNC